MEHPTPWKLAFKPLFKSWDEKSNPMILDANRKVVDITVGQFVGHPVNAFGQSQIADRESTS